MVRDNFFVRGGPDGLTHWVADLRGNPDKLRQYVRRCDGYHLKHYDLADVVTCFVCAIKGPV
jgi:hypothetical protein